jgi:hypothetical protein
MSIEGGPKQDSARLEKQKRWRDTLERLDHTTDLLGEPIEDGIKEAVAGLNVNEIPTNGSCAGHIEADRLDFPYLQGEAEGQPEYRYRGEKEIVEDLMNKFNLSNGREIFRTDDARREYYECIDGLRETEEYKAWYATDRLLHDDVGKLVEEFKATRPESPMHLATTYPGFTIEAQDDQGHETGSRDEIENKIRAAQEEFKAFAEFLKHKYFLR